MGGRGDIGFASVRRSHRSRLTRPGTAVLIVTPLALVAPAAFGAAASGAPPRVRPASEVAVRPALPTSPEVSTGSRLADRRSLVVGDRFYEMGAEDGRYPATGFHTRGEMGGFWTPPIKLLDGLWFQAGDTWLRARSYTSGWGYQRMDLGTHDGVRDHPHRLGARRSAGRPGRAPAGPRPDAARCGWPSTRTRS